MMVRTSFGALRRCSGALCALTLFLGGCISPLTFFNDDFLSALNVAPGPQSLPGLAPAMVLGIRNDTNNPVEFIISWRNAEGNVEQFQDTLLPGVEPEISFVEFCPISEVTLGDITALNATGAVVRLGGGSPADPRIEVEAFGTLLQQGIHFDCGDRIRFVISNSTATLSGYQAFAIIERSGQQTTDPNDL